MNNSNFSLTDVCFLIASSGKKSYQKLSETYSAIEPPTWALLLAQSCRSINYKVSIVDANAENLTNDEVLKKINKLNPRILCLVVYGQNVNAGTANMSGAVDITNYLKIVELNGVVNLEPFAKRLSIYPRICADPPL